MQVSWKFLVVSMQVSYWLRLHAGFAGLAYWCNLHDNSLEPAWNLHGTCNFGELLSEAFLGTALGSSFVSNFLGQLWSVAMRGAAFDDAFWKQLSGAALGNRFGTQLLVATLGSVWYYGYCRLPIFIFFVGRTLVGKAGTSFLLHCSFASELDTLFCDGLRYHVVTWN